MDRYRVLEQQGRVAFSPEPRWLRRLTLALALPGGFLLLGALVLVVAGSIAGFDASFAAIPAVVGAVAVGASSVVSGPWASFRQYSASLPGAGELDLPPLGEVPERDAIRDAQARAIAARLEPQREGRNQSAASGGRVSSTEEGLPPHGSSEAATDP